MEHLLPLSPLQVLHRSYSAVTQFLSIEFNMYALNKRCFAADKKSFFVTTNYIFSDILVTLHAELIHTVVVTPQ